METGEKECPSCALNIPNDAEDCPYCGYELPQQKPVLRYLAILLAVLLIWPAIKLLMALFR